MKRTAYVIASHIPIGLMTVLLLFEDYLKEKLGDGLILLGIIMFASSALITLVGIAVAVFHHRQKKSMLFWLSFATLAMMPAVVYLVLLW